MANDTNEKSIPELQDGSEVIIDGEKYIYRYGHFEEPTATHKNTEPHFYLYFDDRCRTADRKPNAKLPTEINGCPVSRQGKTIEIDIYPILKQVFGTATDARVNSFKGTKWKKHDQVGRCTVVYNDIALNRMRRDIDAMLDLSFVNQNQLRSSKERIGQILDSPFHDFWELFE